MSDGLTALSNLAERIARCADEAGLVGLLRQGSALIGADAAFFASWFLDGTTLASCSFLLACDARWALAYEQGGCLEADPWLRHATQSTEPVSDVRIPCSDERERSVVQLAASFGFRSAAIIPAPAASLRRGGALVLGAREHPVFGGDRFPILKIMARTIAMELRERHAQLLRAAFIRERRIKEADLRLLAYSRQRMSTKRMGPYDGASPGAVDARFRRLNRKFGSPCRETTARLAAAYGLL